MQIKIIFFVFGIYFYHFGVFGVSSKLGYKGDWFEKLTNTDGIFEFRCRDKSKFYRIFAFWDSTDDYKTLIVGTHGLDKKSNKTPKNEIKKAELIKHKYFNSKN